MGFQTDDGLLFDREWMFVHGNFRASSSICFYCVTSLSWGVSWQCLQAKQAAPIRNQTPKAITSVRGVKLLEDAERDGEDLKDGFCLERPEQLCGKWAMQRRTNGSKSSFAKEVRTVDGADHNGFA